RPVEPVEIGPAEGRRGAAGVAPRPHQLITCPPERVAGGHAAAGFAIAVWAITGCGAFSRPGGATSAVAGLRTRIRASILTASIGLYDTIENCLTVRPNRSSQPPGGLSGGAADS